MRCVILSLALTIPAALHARDANAFQLKWNELGLLATAALGYLAGRSADRTILHIHILPGE